jgi:hypothetical protein
VVWQPGHGEFNVFHFAVQFYFKLHNPKHLIKDTDKVTLAFHTEEEAKTWHETFQAVIADLAAKRSALEVPCSSSSPRTRRLLLVL